MYFRWHIQVLKAAYNFEEIEGIKQLDELEAELITYFSNQLARTIEKYQQTTSTKVLETDTSTYNDNADEVMQKVLDFCQPLSVHEVCGLFKTIDDS